MGSRAWESDAGGVAGLRAAFQPILAQPMIVAILTASDGI